MSSCQCWLKLYALREQQRTARVGSYRYWEQRRPQMSKACAEVQRGHVGSVDARVLAWASGTTPWKKGSRRFTQSGRCGYHQIWREESGKVAPWHSGRTNCRKWQSGERSPAACWQIAYRTCCPTIVELSCDRSSPAVSTSLNPEAETSRPQRDAAVAADQRIQDIAENNV